MKFDIVQLGSTGIDVIDGDRGKNYPHQNELLSTGFCLFLSAKNVTKSGFNFSEAQFISQRKDALLNNGRLRRGDIVITTRGTVGNVALYSPQVPYENIRINSGMLIIRCTNNISNQYLYQVLRSEWFQKQIMAVQSGSAQPQLPKSHFLKMNIPLPLLPIQEKIASILQLIDAKITTNNAINDNLQQQAQALYQQMFIDNPVSGGYIGTLSNIADITMGQSPNGSSYNEDGNGTVFFQGRAEFGFRFPSVRLYTTEPKRMACANDTLMSVRAPVGDLNVAYTDCCIGRGLAAIHSKSNQQSFVLYTMFSLRKQLDVFNGEGTVFGSINRTSLNELPIFIPSDREIVKFEAIVAPIDAAIQNNYEEICRLEKIRDALLPKLMSGELDVSAVEL